MIILIIGTLFLIIGIIYKDIVEIKDNSFSMLSYLLVMWLSFSTLFYCISIKASESYLSGKKEPKIIQDNGRTYKEYNIGISTIKVDINE